MYQFSVFEGVDATGKTEISKELMAVRGAQLVCCPPKGIANIREAVRPMSAEINYAYYMLGNLMVGEEVERLLDFGPVLADRYVYSTLAHYGSLLGRELVPPEELILPDTIFYLEATEEKRAKRLKERGETNVEKDLETAHVIIQSYKEIFSGLDNVVTIDTTKTTVDEVVGLILNNF